MDILYQITLPYGTFGIIVGESDWIEDAAPMGRWMIGKSLVYIKSWVKNKKGTIVKI